VTEVAKRLKVTPSTLYRHIPGAEVRGDLVERHGENAPIVLKNPG